MAEGLRRIAEAVRVPARSAARNRVARVLFRSEIVGIDEIRRIIDAVHTGSSSEARADAPPRRPWEALSDLTRVLAHSGYVARTIWASNDGICVLDVQDSLDDRYASQRGRVSLHGPKPLKP